MKKPVNENRNDEFAEDTASGIGKLEAELSELQKEKLSAIVESVYLEGYLDGIRDAIHFAQI